MDFSVTLFENMHKIANFFCFHLCKINAFFSLTNGANYRECYCNLNTSSLGQFFV